MTDAGQPSTSRGSLHPRQTVGDKDSQGRINHPRDRRHRESQGSTYHPRQGTIGNGGNDTDPPAAERREGGEKRKLGRNLPPVPPLGEPKGRDDPLRHGLSGAGVRWYIRYLADGLSPSNARQKAIDRIKKEDAEDSLG